jgi:uncharacterized protein Usg
LPTVSPSRYLKQRPSAFKEPRWAGWQQLPQPAATALFRHAFPVASERFCRHPRGTGDRNRRRGNGVTLYELQVRGYRLTTAEIIYRLPDHPALLQSFIWQKFDLAPDYPELRKFLEFWSRHIEGKLHSVNVKQSSRGAPNRMRYFKYAFTVH